MQPEIMAWSPYYLLKTMMHSFIQISCQLDHNSFHPQHTHHEWNPLETKQMHLHGIILVQGQGQGQGQGQKLPCLLPGGNFHDVQ